MPGTLVSDSLDVLYTATTLAADVDTTAVEVVYPRMIQFEVDTGTIGGTSVTCDITVEGASDSGFSTDVVQLGKFGTLTEASDDVVKGFVTYVDSRYVRLSIVVAGTSPDIDFVCSMREPHYKRTTDHGTAQYPDSA